MLEVVESAMHAVQNQEVNGEVTLATLEFGKIELGSNSKQLLQQIKVINHLSKNLPSKLLDQKDITIDIRDPSKPELQMLDP